MLRHNVSICRPVQWVPEHLEIARKVAGSLKRRYVWLDWDELYSYSLWGITQAAGCYQAGRGMSFDTFARGKAMFAAIDAMRQDRVLLRERNRKLQKRIHNVDPGGDGEWDFLSTFPDHRSGRDIQAVEDRDLVRCALGRLGERDRLTLLMYYADGLTFREIGKVLGKSESAVSILHKNLIVRLRKMFS